MNGRPWVTENPGVRQVAMSPQAEYIESASLVDVLYDQLDYLVTHVSGGCPPGCPDCTRLAQVKAGLLSPFRAPHEIV